MASIRSGVLRVFALVFIGITTLLPPVRAQVRSAAEHLSAGVAHIEQGDYLMALMTLNEVVSAESTADPTMVARAHAYRAQANFGLNQPERARAAALLALEADPAIVVSAPAFSPTVITLFEGLRRPITADSEAIGQAAETAGRYQQAFLAYLSAYQRMAEPPPSSDDRRLRERIIEVARLLEAEPVIPPEAKAHMARAEELLAAEKLLGGSGTASSQAAAAALRQAIRIAPWWPDATFKLAGILQKLQRLDEAVINLNLYRLADPEGYSAAIAAKGVASADSTPARIAAPASTVAASVAPAPATLYIYWPPQAMRGWSLQARGGQPKVLCDGHHVADLQGRRFILLNVTPGAHNIQVDKRTLAISFEAGQTYYVRSYVGGYPARRQAKQVAADEGVPELNDKDMSANEPQRTYSSECNGGVGRLKR